MPATATKSRPLALRDWEVRAILGGQKTQTRQVFRPSKSSKMNLLPDDFWQIDPDEPGTAYLNDFSGRLEVKCPYGKPGDRLTVKEVWALVHFWTDPETGHVDDWSDWDGPIPKEAPSGWTVLYRADKHWPDHRDDRGFNWRSPAIMPKWASRLDLEIAEVRVERLQPISVEDALAEGVDDYFSGVYFPGYLSWSAARANYRRHWESMYGPGSWQDDRWVWVVGVKRMEGRGDETR